MKDSPQISGFAVLCGEHHPAVQMVLDKNNEGWMPCPDGSGVGQYVAIHMCPACEHEIMIVLREFEGSL